MGHNDRILVTGASGFIGGRLVEVLTERGNPVRVAISSSRNTLRISRLPVELVEADLRDHAALARAVTGCNLVFHAAYRFGGTDIEQRQINLEGTRVLAEAFLKNGGRRFVHVSSVSAYGDTRDEELTEETPMRPTADPYSDTKQTIEQVLRQLHRHHGLPLAILQPAIVYGPHGSYWTTRILEELHRTRVALPMAGLGVCNAVYVDDVVSALLLAADCDAAVGEAFLISGSSPTTWREFYGGYEKMLDRKAVIDLDQDCALQRTQLLVRQRLRNLLPYRWIATNARRLLPEGGEALLRRCYHALWRTGDHTPILLAGGQLHALYTSRTRVRTDKARRMLGYNPAFDLEHGMARTAAWARAAQLLNA